MNEFELSTEVTLIQPAIINMNGVDTLLDEITMLSKSMKELEVTEENLKGAKDLLAKVRKQYGQIDAQRVAIKKQVLEPYNELDVQMKEIKRVLDEGEEHVAKQVRALQEAERLERKEQLEELFNSYHRGFNAPAWLTFDKFLVNHQPLVNNKATSRLKKINAITSFFEKWNEDYAKVKAEFPLEQDRTAILVSYNSNGLDMSKAVEAYKSMVEEKERLHAQQLEAKEHKKPKVFVNQKPEQVVIKPLEVTLTLEDERQYDKFIQVLKQNNIKFHL